MCFELNRGHLREPSIFYAPDTPVQQKKPRNGAHLLSGTLSANWAGTLSLTVLVVFVSINCRHNSIQGVICQ